MTIIPLFFFITLFTAAFLWKFLLHIYFVLSCSWQVFEKLAASDHLLILYIMLLSTISCQNKFAPFNFQKACMDGFALHFDLHYPVVEESFSFSLYSLQLLSLLLCH